MSFESKKALNSEELDQVVGGYDINKSNAREIVIENITANDVGGWCSDPNGMNALRDEINSQLDSGVTLSDADWAQIEAAANAHGMDLYMGIYTRVIITLEEDQTGDNKIVPNGIRFE